MASNSPTRIDDDVAASARIMAPTMNRSAAQQVAHWARIGRALEMSPTVSHSLIVSVLAGEKERSYDSLNEQEQAVVRAEWEVTMADRRKALDFEVEFSAAGESYSELDADGNVVQRFPD